MWRGKEVLVPGTDHFENVFRICKIFFTDQDPRIRILILQIRILLISQRLLIGTTCESTTVLIKKSSHKGKNRYYR
jgi:hypothetical protein